MTDSVRRARNTIRGHVSGEDWVEVIPDLPQSLEPGTTETGSFLFFINPEKVVGIGGGELSIEDTDACRANDGSVGLAIGVVVRSGGQVLARDEWCIPRSGDRVTEFAFEVPSDAGGISEISIEVTGAESGNVLASDSIPVSVSGDLDGDGGFDPTEPPDDGTDGDDGSVGNLLPCFLDPDRQCSRTATVAWSLLGVGVVAAAIGS